MACKAFRGFVLLACIIASAVGQLTLFEPVNSITITINEELSLGTSVLQLPTYCGDINSWTEPDFYTVQISPTTYFDWSSAVEAIVVTNRLDRDTPSPGPTTSFTATVTSSACAGTVTLTVNVILHDIDDNLPVPVTLTPPQITNITSTTPIGAQICVVSATDADIGVNALHTYSLLQGGDIFSIDPITGIVTLATQGAYADSPYSVVVEITDAGIPEQFSVTYTFTVSYVITYSAPKFKRNTYVLNINETLAMGPIWLLNVSAAKSDPDPMTYVTYSIFSDPSGMFTVDPTTGAVSIQGPLLASTSPRYVAIIQATLVGISSPYSEYYCSSSEYRAYSAVQVLIRDTLNLPPTCLHDVYFFDLPENTAVGSLVGTNIGAVDYDLGTNGIIAYSLASDSSGGTFQIQIWQNIVSLYLLTPVVYERLVNKTFVLMIKATDGGGQSCTMTIYIGVGDVNNKPPVVQPATYCIHESWTTGVVYCVPTAINVTDVDSPAVNGLIVLSVTGDSRFSINVLNQLCVHDLDYELEQVVYITVLAKDNGGVAPYNEGNALFTINVINDNDNSPYFVPYSAAIVLVEKLPYTNFLTFQVYDADLPPYNNLCVNISDTSNNFTMQQGVLLDNGKSITTAQLSVTTVLLYSVQQQWNIILTATDLGCASTPTTTSPSSDPACSSTAVALNDTATVIVSVTCGTYPPTFTRPAYSGCMLENTTGLTLLAPIIATDPLSRPVFYAIQSQQVSAFSIDNVTGVMSVVTPSLVDYESYPPNPHRISVTVVAWSSPGNCTPPLSASSTATVLIQILPVNEFAPVVTDVYLQSQPVVQFAPAHFSPPALVYYVPENKLCDISIPLMTLTAYDTDTFDWTSGCSQSLPYYTLNSVTPANRVTVSQSGQVMLTSCLDYSPVYSNGACPTGGDRNISVQVMVCDCQGFQPLLDCHSSSIMGQQQCSMLSFTIVVVDVNDNPPIVTTNYLSCLNILENTPGGTLVTTINSIDCDFGTNAVTYYDILDVGTAGDKFTLHTFNGSITVSPGAILDYEVLPNNFTFVVGAYNPTNPVLESPNNVTVNICLINSHDEPPYFIGCPYDWTIAENDNTVLTGTVVVTSRDTSILGNLMYSLYVPPTIPATWFTIPNPSSPDIVVNGVDRENANLTNVDGLGRAIVIMNITVTDGKFTTTCQITVYILDVNDNPPIFNLTIYTAYMDECSSIGTYVTTVYATDADATPQNRIILYTITSGNTNSEFGLGLYSGVMTTQQPLNHLITMSYTMALLASNPDGLYSASLSVATAYIYVNDCNNNPPVFTNCPHEWVIYENNNIALTGIMATDADINPLFRNLTYSLAVLTPPVAVAWFTIPNPSSSDIEVNGVDREQFTSGYVDQVLRGIVTMTMNVTDGKFTSTCQIIVYVLDVNDNPPVFTPSNYTTYVNECSPIGTYVTTVYATDADATPQNRIILYTITSGNTNNGFQLNINTGLMTTQQSLNYLITTNYTMALLASNPDGLYNASLSEASVYIFVNECNIHAPVFIGCPYQWVIYENTNTTLTGIFATDGGINAQFKNLTYSLNFQNALQPIPTTWFSIYDPYSPNISVFSVDRENLTEADSLGRGIVRMTISVTDGLYAASCQITVLVVDVNDNPPIFSPRYYVAAVLECSLIGTIVDVVYATDADATPINRIIIYTIVSGNSNNTFVLNNSTGVITTLGQLSTCITPSYSLAILAANPDGLNNSILAIDNITVDCCNEYSPVFTSPLYNAIVLEYNSLVPTVCSQPAGILVSVSATDADCCPMYRNVTGYSIIGGDSSGIFAINAMGNVSVVHPELIDYEQTSFHLLTIAAMDGGIPPLSGITLLSVTVTAQHDHCPVFGVPVYTASVHQDAPNGTALQIYPPIVASGGEETSPMLSFSISGGPFNITADGTIVRTTMPVVYVQSMPYYVLTVNVTDPQIGRENTSNCATFCNASAILNITVLPTNTRCIFTPDWVNYCPSLASYIPIGSVIKTVQCVDTDLGLNGVVTYFLYGGAGYFAIDANTGNITVANSLVNSVSAQYTITVVAQDLGSPPRSASITMSFTIQLDRNPPYFTTTVFSGSVSTSTPIGTTVVTVVATDDDAPLVPQGVIQYTIEPWTPPMPFSINATTGEVYVNSSLSAFNGLQPFYVFLVKALDGYCWQAVPDAIVEINIVDKPKPSCALLPTAYSRSSIWLLYTANFSIGLWENAPNGSLVIDLQLVSSSPLSNFSLIAWSAGANSTFHVYSNGSITVQNTLIRAMLDYYIPAYILTVMSQCGGTTSIITVSIYVLDVNNHAPVISNISYCIPEFTPIGTNITQLTLHATDIDLFENSYIVYNCTQPAPVFVADAVAGVVTLSTTLNRLVISQYPLVLCYATDRDGRGLATAAYLNITVCPYINHPPYMQPTLQNMTVCEKQAPGFVGKILAYDIDTVYSFNVINYYFVDWVSYSNGMPSSASINQTYPFFIDVNDGSVYTTAQLNRDTVDYYAITVKVSNNDTASMKNISTTGTLIINVCDINNHPPVISSSLVCIAQYPSIGTSVTVLKATDADVPNSPFSTVWFYITDQTLGFTVDNISGLITTNGYNGAADQDISLPVLAYDNYGMNVSLSSMATVEVVVYGPCNQVVMTLCEPIQTVENFCGDLITGMLSGTTGFGVCATQTDNVGDSVQVLTDLYLYFYDNKTFQGLTAHDALALIDLNSDLLSYFQSSGCCIKDVKPYSCPTLAATAVPIWVPSSIAGLLALILSMICCVACIAASYWCRKYKKLKVTKSNMKRSLTSQLEQFSYQSEVNTTTNPLWVPPYEVDSASTVYESQELTIDMFQDDDSSQTTETVTRPNQLYESQELVVDVFSDEDFEPLVKQPPAKPTLYESQELKVDMFHDDFEPSTSKLLAKAPQYESQELKVDMYHDNLEEEPLPKKLPAKAPQYESQELKVDMFHDNTEFDLEPLPPKAPSKTQLYESQELKVDMALDNTEFDLEPLPSKRTPKKAEQLYESQELKVDMVHDNTEFDLEPVPTKRTPKKTEQLYESQELKVDMFHDNTEFDLKPLTPKRPAIADPLYESQELKVEMFHGNMDDDQEPLTVKKQTKTSKVTKSQKQQSSTTAKVTTSRKQESRAIADVDRINPLYESQELKVEMFGNMDNDDLKSSSSHLFKGKTSTPLHVESTTSDDDLLAQALDGSGVLLPTAK